MQCSGRYSAMGFTAAKKRLLECLGRGDIQHEARDAMAEKNLLAIGDISPEEVAALVRRCRGPQYESSPHDTDASIEVHTFHVGRGERKPPMGRWYIKAYFLDEAWFISVHQ